MKSYSIVILLLLAIFGQITSVSAQPYIFTYSKLYAQMKHNADTGHEDVKVGFFFVNADTKALCLIDKAWMESKEHSERLEISPANELLVPLDANLKQVNPLIQVDTERGKRCDFSMVVMTKQPLSDQVSYEEIEALLPQMQSMLEALGGMFASWFTPDVEGLTLEFSPGLAGEITLPSGQTLPIENSKVEIRLSDLEPGQAITLPEPTLRTLPWLPSAK